MTPLSAAFPYIDTHTAGHPTRVILGGIPALEASQRPYSSNMSLMALATALCFDILAGSDHSQSCRSLTIGRTSRR